MNEIEFTRMTRRLESGDVVLCAGTLSADAFPQGVSAASGAGSLNPGHPDLVAIGIVLAFLDPSKPLLVFRRVGERGRFTVDFFQDVLYAHEPLVETTTFGVLRSDATSLPRWRGAIAASIGHPLASDSDRFDAYATGALSAAYTDPVAGDAGTPAEWAERHLLLAGAWLTSLVALVAPTSVWEGHDVFTFR